MANPMKKSASANDENLAVWNTFTGVGYYARKHGLHGGPLPPTMKRPALLRMGYRITRCSPEPVISGKHDEELGGVEA